LAALDRAVVGPAQPLSIEGLRWQGGNQMFGVWRWPSHGYTFGAFIAAGDVAIRESPRLTMVLGGLVIDAMSLAHLVSHQPLNRNPHGGWRYCLVGGFGPLKYFRFIRRGYSCASSWIAAPPSNKGAT
jgi:hypothetical protein